MAPDYSKGSPLADDDERSFHQHSGQLRHSSRYVAEGMVCWFRT